MTTAEKQADETPERRLSQLLQDDVDEFKRCMDGSRLKTLLLRVGAAALGATASVCVGLQRETFNPLLSAAALISGALVTVLAAWEGVFDYKSDWEKFRYAFGRLYELLYRLKYIMSKGSIEPNELDDIAKKHREIILEVNTPGKPDK